MTRILTSGNPDLRLLIFLSLLALMLFDPDEVSAQMIVAHRGASYDAPENTLTAFRLAWEKQADAIEGDFYLTSDNQIVCIHDRTTKRVAPGQPELNVSETTLEELRKLDVGRRKNKKHAGEKIPTLAEVLETVPDGKQIFVEIKCGPEILPVLKQQLSDSGLKPDQIVIISFNEDVIAQSRTTMPQYRANWLIGYKHDEKMNEWKPGLDQVLAKLKETGATGIGTNGNLNVVNKAFAEAIKSAGLEFHIWTVNNVEHARKFSLLEADSITTDRPAFIRDGLSK